MQEPTRARVQKGAMDRQVLFPCVAVAFAGRTHPPYSFEPPEVLLASLPPDPHPARLSLLLLT